MFPIGDDNSDRTITPYVNYLFIAINVMVFVFLQGLGGNDTFNYAFSLVPKEITTGIDLTAPQIIRDAASGQTAQIPNYATPLPVYFNFLSSMFMHGGFMHLFGNMLFLWVFGDNLENMLGHIRFALFYVACGIAAAFAQIVMDTGSIIPMLGASGAISGILGGYILLFPTRRVRALLFNVFTTVPAYVALGLWIGMQLLQGYLSPAGQGGVAYAAHIGGFIAGLVLIKIFALGTKAQNISPGQG
ncbi:MAG: rhomboid family intramembrane serine protease [Acidobacteria bacterium]|nr:rhomboid family intramembrane serine protease [Acidobacteriota bacterium]MCA1638357.1 rhomboid family intramembrane serine protease [Acidobacteriota bacterium]